MTAALSPTDEPDLVAAILGRGTITAEDVLALRRHVFADGIVARREAETMFALNEGTRKVHQSYYLPMTTAMAVALFE